MATTHRSDLVDEIEKALRDEAYDGGMGALMPEQFTDYVRGLAVTAAKVVEEAHAPIAGSCWDAAPRVVLAGEVDPTPTLCELTAGHQGAHRSGRTEWMHSRPLTPTDDEREAQGWREAALYAEEADSQDDFMTGWRTADRTRSEVPEPSAEGWSTEDRREALAEGLRRWSVQSQHDRVEQRDHDLYGMGARQGFALGAEWWKATHPAAVEPQGEPSDADVDRGVAAFIRSGYYEAESNPGGALDRAIRAVLRAASEAGGEGAMSAEEPEWEYGWHTGSTVSLIGRREQIDEWLMVRGWKLGEGDWGSRIMQRTAAGPWVPVKQEGAEK